MSATSKPAPFDPKANAARIAAKNRAAREGTGLVPVPQNKPSDGTERERLLALTAAYHHVKMYRVAEEKQASEVMKFAREFLSRTPGERRMMCLDLDLAD